MRALLLALPLLTGACQSTPDAPSGEATPTGNGSSVIDGSTLDAVAPPTADAPAADRLGTGSEQIVGDYACESGQPFDNIQVGILDGEGTYTGSTRLGEDGDLRPIEEGNWFFEDGRLTFTDGASSSVTYAPVLIDGDALRLTTSTGDMLRCERQPVSP